MSFLNLSIETLLLVITIGYGLKTVTLLILKRNGRRVWFSFRQFKKRIFLSGFWMILLWIAGIVILQISPLFFLTGVLFLPIFLLVCLHFFQKKEQEEFDRECLRYFRTLQGFILGGLSLPSAVQILETTPGKFSKWFGRFLRRFKKGKVSFSQTILDFQRLIPVKRTAPLLQGVSLSFEKGLPLVPFLEWAIPLLEREERLFQKILELKIGATLQAIFGFLLPWLLLALFRQLANAYSMPPYIYLGILLWQGLGIFFLIERSKFYRRKGRPLQGRFLNQFLLLLKMYLQAGFDLRFAWKELSKSGAFGFANWEDGVSFRTHLQAIDIEKTFKPWIVLILELYEQGVPLLQAVDAFQQYCMQTLEQELEQFHRNFPTQMNLISIFFFIPPLFGIFLLQLIFSLQ